MPLHNRIKKLSYRHVQQKHDKHDNSFQPRMSGEITNKEGISF